MEKGRFNVATDSFFKAFVTLCDHVLQEKVGYLPKNHTERFDMLKLHYIRVFSIASALFKKYRRTYNLKASKEDAEDTKREYLKLAKEV